MAAAIAALLFTSGCAKRTLPPGAVVRARLDLASLGDGHKAGDRLPMQLFLVHDPYHCRVVAVFPAPVLEAVVSGADEPAVEDEPLAAATSQDNVLSIQLAPRVHPVQFERYANGVGVVVSWRSSPVVTFTAYLASSDTGFRMNRGDPFIWYHAILFIPYVKHIVLLSQAWVAGNGRTGIDGQLRSGDERLGFRQMVETDAEGWTTISIEPFDEAQHDRPRAD